MTAQARGAGSLHLLLLRHVAVPAALAVDDPVLAVPVHGAVPPSGPAAAECPGEERRAPAQEEAQRGGPEQQRGGHVQQEVLAEGQLVHGGAQVGGPAVAQHVLDPVHGPLHRVPGLVPVDLGELAGALTVAVGGGNRAKVASVLTPPPRAWGDRHNVPHPAPATCQAASRAVPTRKHALTRWGP